MPQCTIAVNTANTVCRQLAHAESGFAEPFFWIWRSISVRARYFSSNSRTIHAVRDLRRMRVNKDPRAIPNSESRSYPVPFSEQIAKASIINLLGKLNRLEKKNLQSSNEFELQF